MQRILTFESFIPKNIEKRAKDLEIIKSQQLKEYEDFIKEFEHNLKAIQDKTSNDPQEQLFIDLIKNTEIKLDQQKHPFSIFLLQDDKWIFEYDWRNDEFWCHYDRVWSVFRSKFNMEYQNWQDFISDMVEKHFKFRLSTIFCNSLL